MKGQGGGGEGHRAVWTGGLIYLPDLQFDSLPLYFHSANLEINSWGERCKDR